MEEDKGLAALPEPSAGDLFFDIEGDTFAGDGGLEYLFGFADREGRYEARWALDPEAEKRAFEGFIDEVMARWERHPGFHVYHYAPYETTAVKRLMSRYATREEEVDKLLRGRVFVDLYRVVRQGLRASVESYSIKKLEPFYRFARDVDLGEATRSLVALEVRIESGSGAGVPDGLRAQVEGYNRDDCLSTLRLAEWLESCRGELESRTGQPVPRPAARDEERERERESAAEVQAVFDALVAGLPESEEDLDDEQRARRLLAHLLEFHRREDKSTWWEFFDRCEMGPAEFVEHRATLGGLTCAGEAGQVKRSVIHRYRFPEQTHEIEVGDSPKNPDTAESDDLQRGFCGTVVALDEAGRTIDLKRGRKSPVPHPGALVPLDTVNSSVLRESLLRLGREVAGGGFLPGSPRRAAFDLLRRVRPRVGPAALPGAESLSGETAPPAAGPSPVSGGATAPPAGGPSHVSGGATAPGRRTEPRQRRRDGAAGRRTEPRRRRRDVTASGKTEPRRRQRDRTASRRNEPRRRQRDRTASRRNGPRRLGRDTAGRRAADRPAARPLGAAGAGAARQRQDVHRRADDPRSAGRREAGRRDRQQPQGNLQPARRRLPRGGRRARRARGGRPRDPEGERR